MYCSNCGKKLKEGMNFCDSCGTKVESNIPEKTNIKDGKVFKCPSCGEILPYGTLKCHTCGHEIRGRKGASSIQDFSDKLLKENEQTKIIELIKTFPIPNTREDIIEFMFLASSNFDARYYATNKAADSISGAWLSKMDQCYQKGKVMFDKEIDLNTIETIYNDAHLKIKTEEKRKMKLTVLGIIITVLSLVLTVAYGQTIPVLGYVFITMLVIGIVLIVKGLKKNKTNTQMIHKSNRNNQDEEKDGTFKYTIFNTTGRIVNKNKYVSLAIYFGWAGAHRRYAGQRRRAFLYLFTFGLFGFGWIRDVVNAKKQKPDTYGNVVI